MKILLKNKHWKINKEYDIDKILYLLIDKPNHINSLDDFIWENKKNQHHREYDLPAYICSVDHIEWCKNDLTHRKNNKPAVIKFDGLKEYFINGIFIKKEK